MERRGAADDGRMKDPVRVGRSLQAAMLSSAVLVFLVLCAAFYLVQHYWLSENRARENARQELQHTTRVLGTTLRTCGLSGAACTTLVEAIAAEHRGASITVNDASGQPLITVLWQKANPADGVLEHQESVEQDGKKLGDFTLRLSLTSLLERERQSEGEELLRLALFMAGLLVFFRVCAETADYPDPPGTAGETGGSGEPARTVQRLDLGAGRKLPFHLSFPQHGTYPRPAARGVREMSLGGGCARAGRRLGGASRPT